MNPNKTYLGDAVYAAADHSGIILTTENGISITNTIYLDWPTLHELDTFTKRLSEANRPQAKGEREKGKDF